MKYQERFSEQRNELFNHFNQGFDVVGVSKVDVSGLRQGVREYAEKEGYFKLTPQEIDEMNGEDAFAEDATKEIQRRWRNDSVDDVVKIFRDKAGKVA